MVSMGGSRQGQTQTQSLSRFDPNTAQSRAYMGQVEPRAEAIGEPIPFELPHTNALLLSIIRSFLINKVIS